MALIEYLRKMTKRIKYYLSTDWCYDRMEADGHADNFRCCGLAGGTRKTDYLSEMCIDCPYLDLYWIGKER